MGGVSYDPNLLDALLLSQMADKQKQARQDPIFDGEIRNREPSWADWARNGVADTLSGFGMDPRNARDMSEKLLGRPFPRPEADGLSNMMDGMGLLGTVGLTAPLEAGQAYTDARQGNYGASAMSAGSAALDALPILGYLGRSAKGVVGAGRAAGWLAGSGGAMRDAKAAKDAGNLTYGILDNLAPPGSGYVPASGKPGLLAIPDVGKFEARPVGPIEQAAQEYMAKRGIDFAPASSYPQFDENRARRIAQAYEDMRHNPSDPAVKRAYDAMIEETLNQYNALKDTGIDFKFIPPGMSDPYARSPSLGYKDMVENGRLWVFPTEQGFGTSAAFDPSENPLLKRVGRVGDLQNATANDAFRVVHDAFGHFGPGNPFFRHQGEERAWIEHSRMYSPDARGAMTSETRGQNSWLNFGPHGEQNRSALGANTVFADQKTGLMPEWTWYDGGLLR